MAEPHRVGVAAVLAADPQLQALPGLAALLAGDLHQPADAGLVDGHERVGRDQLALLVQAEELADVVAGEPEGGLGEVVGAEGEELGHLGDLAGDQGRPWQLDHRPPQHLELLAGVAEGLAGHRLQLLAQLGQLLAGRGQRDHDLHDRVAAVGLDLGRGLDDGPDLHGVQPRLDDAKANPAQPQHRVGLVQVVDLGQHLFGLVQGHGLVAAHLDRRSGPAGWPGRRPRPARPGRAGTRAAAGRAAAR